MNSASKYDRLRIRDLRDELNDAIKFRLNHPVNERWLMEEIGVTPEFADDLPVGVLPITVFRGAKAWEPREQNHADKIAAIIPTGFRDEQHVIDLLATDGRHCWLRFGSATWLGDPAEVEYLRVSEWIASSGKGCVYLGDM